MTRVSINPPDHSLDTSVRPPGSKSHTIRALFAAGAAQGESDISGPLDSADTERTRECLAELGTRVEEQEGRWVVGGVAGEFSAPGAHLDAGESGLTARFLLALSPFIPSPIVIKGRGRLPERPMTTLIDNLAERGAITSKGHPWQIDATGAARSGSFTVDASSSSQVVSALLLAAPLGASETNLTVTNMRSSAGYVSLTTSVMAGFGGIVTGTEQGYRVEGGGYVAGRYEVPVDASSAVYPACAAALTGGSAEIMGDLGEHPDRKILDVLSDMGCEVGATDRGVTVSGPARLEPAEVDMSDAPDAAVCLAVVCARAGGTSRISGLESLRRKESDRLAALHSELTKFGTKVETDAGSIVVTPGTSRAAVFDSHNDHRIAMSLALLGLVSKGIAVDDPMVVNKTWPGYWAWLESTGAEIVNSE